MRSIRIGLFSAVLALVVNVAAARAAEGFTSRFQWDGDAQGWKVNGCKASFTGGKLLLESGNGFVSSPYRYGDFVLSLQWKPLKASAWDSGIYIRSELPTDGKPWPARYQINLKQGEDGNLLGLSEGTSKGLVKPGEWNHLKLTVVGDRAEAEINGKPAWKVSGIEPRDGFIGFQSEVEGGGQFEFREVEITEIGYKPLFNGQDLSGWQGALNGYSVENGILVCRKEGGGNLYTSQQYKDFSVRLEIKMEPGGNNGLGLRAPLRGDAAYTGMEVQILDDFSPQYKDLQPYQYHGSVYGIASAKRGHLNEPGKWNYQEVTVHGRHVTIHLNGAKIVDVDLDEASNPKTLDGKDHPGLARTEGYLGLLGHGSRIEFRNLRIKEL